MASLCNFLSNHFAWLEILSAATNKDAVCEGVLRWLYSGCTSSEYVRFSRGRENFRGDRFIPRLVIIFVPFW